MAISELHATVHANTEPAEEALDDLESKVRDVEGALNDLNAALSNYDGVSIEFEIKED